MFCREAQHLSRQQLLVRAPLRRLEETHNDIGTARRHLDLSHVVLDEVIDRQRGCAWSGASLLDEVSVDLDWSRKKGQLGEELLEFICMSSLASY